MGLARRSLNRAIPVVKDCVVRPGRIHDQGAAASAAAIGNLRLETALLERERSGRHSRIGPGGGAAHLGRRRPVRVVRPPLATRGRLRDLRLAALRIHRHLATELGQSGRPSSRGGSRPARATSHRPDQAGEPATARPIRLACQVEAGRGIDADLRRSKRTRAPRADPPARAPTGHQVQGVQEVRRPRHPMGQPTWRLARSARRRVHETGSIASASGITAAVR